MQWKDGEYWLRDAVKYIRFPPDRRRVQEELYEHMISRNLELLAQGCSEAEADRLACEAMGDPEEVGRALAAVHKPFWGYFLRALRIALAVVLVLGMANTLRNWGFMNFFGSVSVYRSNLERYEAHMEEWIPQSSEARCGDYRFRLKRAGVCAPREDMQFIPEGYWLAMELRASVWDPRLEPPDYDAIEASAEDSLGNRYEASLSREAADLIFFSDTTVIVRGFDPTADWAVLILRAGKNELRFPVVLKEGAA